MAMASQQTGPLGLSTGTLAFRLRDVAIEATGTFHGNHRTQTPCAGWIRRFIPFYARRRRRKHGDSDGNRFPTHLAVNSRVIALTPCQLLPTILYLDEHVLRPRCVRVEDALRPRCSAIAEAARVVPQRTDDRHFFVALFRGGGLRLLAAMRLRVKQLEHQRGEIAVREAAVAKGRATISPQVARHALPDRLPRMRAIHQPDLTDGYDIAVVQELPTSRGYLRDDGPRASYNSTCPRRQHPRPPDRYKKPCSTPSAG